MSATCANTPLDRPIVLKRQLGVWACIAMTISPIIGSGIFISPKGILVNVSGSVGWSLVIWILCGVIAIAGALSLAELSTMMKKSGGMFTYMLMAYSKLLAFLLIFGILVLIGPPANALVSLTMATYFLSPFVSSTCVEIPGSAIILLAIGVNTLIVVLNIYSVKWSYRLEIVLTSVKLLGLTMIILIGIVRLYQGHTSSFEDAFSGTLQAGNVALAFYAGMFAYSGWQLMPTVIEEIENPGRNIPIAIGSSVTLVTIVYLLTNVAYFTALSSEQLLASPAVASDFARTTIGEWAWMVQILVGLSCLSSTITATFAAARTIFVSAREGLTPEILAMISIRRLTPVPAIIALHVITLSMMAFNDVYALLNYLSFSTWLFTGIVISIVPYWRWKYPNIERPYKVPIVFPILFIVCSLFVTCLSLYSAPRDCGTGIGVLLIGVVIYFIFVYWRNKPMWFNNAVSHTTHFFQKMLMVVHQEKPTY
ncbi:cystine/glutamate transporter-like [Amphiura filiformis]|uniref:cystine/glutamate transporter-like n=1 Tax=Amphiura filiformis TaxID=82378 RepID=UPI003B2139A7